MRGRLALAHCSHCHSAERDGGGAMIELHLPMPPSANRLWRRSGARMHKSSQYTEWLRVAGLMVMAQRIKGITGPYKLSIQLLRPDKRRRDLDNRIKSIN